MTTVDSLIPKLDSGFLFHEEAGEKWTKQYFVLHERTLYWFKSRSGDSQMIGRLVLTGKSDCSSTRMVKKPNAFRVTAGKDSHFFAVQQPEEMGTWMGSISKVIAKLKKMEADQAAGVQTEFLNEPMVVQPAGGGSVPTSTGGCPPGGAVPIGVIADPTQAKGREGGVRARINFQGMWN